MSAGERPRVYLVEDHPLMREATTDYLEVKDARICGEAATAEEALERVEEARPDVILVDTSLPGASGIDFVVALRERGVTVPCIMLSGHGEPAYVRKAFAAGAIGYVLKGDPRELPGAIRDVLAGREYVSASLRHALVDRQEP